MMTKKNSKTIEVNLAEVMVDLNEIGKDVKRIKDLEEKGVIFIGHKVSKLEFPVDYKIAMKVAMEGVDEYCKTNSVPKDLINPELVKKGYDFLKDKPIMYF